MTDDPIRIRRNQLKEIIGEDNDAILNFEKVFIVVQELIDLGIEARLVALEAIAVDHEARITALEP